MTLITAIISKPTIMWLLNDEKVICWLSALSWASTDAIFLACPLFWASMTWVFFSLSSFLLSFSTSPALTCDYLYWVCSHLSCTAKSSWLVRSAKMRRWQQPQSAKTWMFRRQTFPRLVHSCCWYWDSYYLSQEIIKKRKIKKKKSCSSRLSISVGNDWSLVLMSLT